MALGNNIYKYNFNGNLLNTGSGSSEFTYNQYTTPNISNGYLNDVGDTWKDLMMTADLGYLGHPNRNFTQIFWIKKLGDIAVPILHLRILDLAIFREGDCLKYKIVDDSQLVATGELIYNDTGFSTVLTDQFKCIALVWENVAGTVRLYENGVDKGIIYTGDNLKPVYPYNASLILDAWLDSSLANTALDDVQLYWGDATAQEISDIYIEGREQMKCEPVTFSPENGTYDRKVVVTMATVTEGATIRYTTNESEPNENSSIYNGAVTFTNTVIIKAKAYAEGYSGSDTTEITYTINTKEDIIMGMPKIEMAFKQKIAKAISRGSSGVVAIILKDASVTELKEYTIQLVTEIPDTLSADNQELLNLIFLGTPKTVKAVVIPAASETIDVDAALEYLEITKFNLLCAPDATTDEVATIASWIKSVRGDEINKKVMAILYDIAVADHEGLINFTTETVKTKVKTFTGKQYTARIAGLIAGQSLTIAPTFAVLQEVLDITPRLTKTQADAAIDAGELVLINDGTKVKIARGVTSLLTTTTDKGEDWKKIKIVRICDLVSEDIKAVIADEYQGKVNNVYINKLLLMSAINAYLEALEKSEFLDPDEDNSAEIDVDEQRLYLQSIGTDTSEMSEQEIKEANTKDNLFWSLHIKPTDAMEDFYITINM